MSRSLQLSSALTQLMMKQLHTTTTSLSLTKAQKLSQATNVPVKRKFRRTHKTLTRKWQVRWLNKYVALKINFQHNRIQANIIDSFPATQIKYYLRRTKLDTHGHIARKRLHMARESFFVLTKILEDLKAQLMHSGSEEIRPVAAPILGRIFFRGWNIRLKLRKVIRHIKATYKYTKNTVFTQVAYRTFSRMFSPRKSRRRNRRKKLRSLRRIRYIRQKELRKVKAIRKFTKRYVSSVCTVRPVLTVYHGSPERFLHQQLGFADALKSKRNGDIFRKAMSVQLRHLHRKGFVARKDDWYQRMYYRRVYARVIRGAWKPLRRKWGQKCQRASSNKQKVRRARWKHYQRQHLRTVQSKINSLSSYTRKVRMWGLYCAAQQQATGRYAKQLNVFAWQRVLSEVSQSSL